MKREQETVDRGQGVAAPHPLPPTPCLKEIDRLRLEKLNLSISNLNLQLALLNERARALQIETAGIRAEREGLVNNITLAMMSNNELAEGWRLNPDTVVFEQEGMGKS